MSASSSPRGARSSLSEGDTSERTTQQPDLFDRALGGIAGGRVLDVATGTGSFIGLLIEKLESHRQIVGIDVSERGLGMAQEKGERAGVCFLRMDASHMGFADASFDTVTVSASLHHLTDIPGVLGEAMRVLKPGGHFVVAEMHGDGQTAPQQTMTAIHRWAGEVDTALGIPHNPTLARQAMVDLIEGLGLHDVTYHDHSDVDADPMAEEAIQAVENVFDRYLARAEGVPAYEALEARAEVLRQRLHEVGVQPEPRLVAVGRKPG